MRSLKRLQCLPRAEWLLLLQAVFSIVLVHIALRCLAVQRVPRFVSRAGWRSNSNHAAHRIAWATRAAARFIPRSTCLVQAIAGQVLLIRYGYQPRLMIGVMKDADQRFQAHAWVACDERILIGGPGAERYTSLLTLGSLS